MARPFQPHAAFLLWRRIMVKSTEQATPRASRAGPPSDQRPPCQPLPPSRRAPHAPAPPPASNDCRFPDTTSSSS
ncbi:hypothetical protein D8O27_20940 [Burkholderia mallei]|uniref:Uncharacterized protein n=4 Tax=pseudomallei group TaxID=111527 RepID=A0AAX1XD29_BURML|nr:hypothetical protein BPC006_II1824 [Burkholderia pseudomallei BPC006]ARK47349.1 hypothetical protein BOC35_14555 [Burkholderia pseudomallei]EDO90010.1 hypothetical protein BURPSPAST_T0219 [Burkholderia pseudomallei Pasteur 52237]PNW98149.1 hypothetical protein CF649_26615 [Burkholderia sp. 136(2017)]PNX11820.1 hypothetical protein CF650_27910 [Burkholderia sp. 129]PNX26241.1 hypothetical protein CF647_26250 [Burkholderia sp. 117]PNX34785.1 hypothetical protein CF648_26620 [Burkholderia sp.